MDKDTLKQTIVNANKAYREGKPFMSDIDFDELVEQYQSLVSKEEYSNFRDSLHEVAGKVKHPFIMGSLNKLKAEEPKEVIKFIKENVSTLLNVSAKVDGISCRLHYENGKLITASTRGDGYFGEDLTDKIKFVKNVIEICSIKDDIDIRGELVIVKKDFEKISDKFANPRNATAGIMNKKEWTKEEISLVTFIPYTILGKTYTKNQQFVTLKEIGFNTAWYLNIEKKAIDYTVVIDKLLYLFEQDFEYEVDGLVLSDADYINEDKYRPDKQVAFKANQLIATTRIVDIVFEGPSKNGSFIPVAILEPVNLGGCVVSRATCHNLDYLRTNQLKYGSIVKVLKAGDIIPKIIDVVDNTSGTEIEFPVECPCCGTKLVETDLNLKCPNKKCKAQVIEQIVLFIKKLGCKYASNATLDKLGIHSFEDLITFTPNKKYKTEVKLYDELLTKVFTRSKKDLLAATNFNGLAEINISKIVDFYGFENIEQGKYIGYPDGIGEIILSKFKDDVLDNLEIVNMFIKDHRYNCLKITQEVIKNINGMSVCFTGKLNTLSRAEAEKLAINAGFKIKNVNKKLTYLVTNDITTGSSKNRKAHNLGITILTENDFLNLISKQTIENNLNNL